MKFMQTGLSSKDKARLKQAKNIASTSDCDKMHGAVAEGGGRVIGVGVNSYRNSRHIYEEIPRDARSTHAEMACLRAIGGDARGATFYVARVNRSGEERMSKPCSYCQTHLIAAGVKRVVYTIDSEMVLS